MNEEIDYKPIKFDLPTTHIRALKARAAYHDCDPRDVVVEALEKFLVKEIAEAKQRVAAEGKPSDDAGKKKGRSGT